LQKCKTGYLTSVINKRPIIIQIVVHLLIKHNFQLEVGGAQSVQWLGNDALDDQNLILSRVKGLLSSALCLNHFWGLPDLLFDVYCVLYQEAVVVLG